MKRFMLAIGTVLLGSASFAGTCFAQNPPHPWQLAIQRADDSSLLLRRRVCVFGNMPTAIGRLHRHIDIYVEEYRGIVAALQDAKQRNDPVATAKQDYLMAVNKRLAHESFSKVQEQAGIGGELIGQSPDVINARYRYPDAAEYCSTALTEAVKRDPSLKALYAHLAKLMGLKDPELVRASISVAALENKKNYEIGGAVNALHCPLAFDAGMTTGMARANQAPLKPEVTDAQLAAVTRDCFAPESTMHTVYGYLAGFRLGQTLGKSGLGKRAAAR